MKDADCATILRQLPDLLRAVQLTPEFTSQLLRLRVITLDGLKELEAEPVLLERCRRLLHDIPHRGPHAFDGLVRALLESGQLAAARLLRPTPSQTDLPPATTAAGSGAAAPPSAQPHCVPTTPVHPPPQPAPRPPAEPQQPVEDQTDAPGPNLRLRPALRVRPAERLLGNMGDSYRMMSQPRGMALIISNVSFSDESKLPKREGGEVDEEMLPSLFQQLGFEVELKRNLDRSQMLAAITAFAKHEAHAEHDMAVLAVLTHGGCRGGHHVLCGVDGGELKVEEAIGCFSHEKAPQLVGKPKWLLFQACRGSKSNRVMPLANRQATDGLAIGCSGESQLMAEFGDIYLTYSTIPDYVSLRDLDHGTWLVQILCKVFAKFAHERAIDELHMIVEDRMRNTLCTVKGVTQSQTIETSQRGWRKKLYFNPGL